MTLQETIDAMFPAPRQIDLPRKMALAAILHEQAATQAVRRGGGRVSRDWVAASAQWAECRRWMEEMAA